MCSRQEKTLDEDIVNKIEKVSIWRSNISLDEARIEVRKTLVTLYNHVLYFTMYIKKLLNKQ